MGWTERQHRMLQAMGLRVWSAPTEPDTTAVPPDARGAPEPEPVSVPVSVPVPVPVPVSVPARLPARLPSPSPSPAVTSVATVATPPAAAVPLDLDWPALPAAVAGCRACGLCESRRQTVVGVGAQRAHWMVIGDAPGEQEDRQGEPFVGSAGQLLDRMLAALGLSRQAEGPDPARQVYIANVLKCRPPHSRNPAPEEMASCEPFLVRQIELLQPRIILAMGRFAVPALLRNNDAIGRLRGRLHRYHGVPLVVTYDPGYLLRHPHEKAKAWDDLCLAAATAEQAQR